jgi:superfamily II DNA/RNA helicase
VAWRRREQLADRLTQLTSHMSADENARTFDRLRLSRTDLEALDLVLATNMVSVGLDVARLAVMVVNGQPLNTAEYIQASSRVGRGEVPGLVIANYYRDQARSLSHYESFRAYHESFYRFVEPTSVTPFTYQARLRALHAALVIAVRHADGHLTANETAGYFDPADPAIGKLVEELKLRCRRADVARAADTAAHIDALAAQWADAAQRCREQRERLVYQGPDNDHRDRRLLYSHEARVKGLWATLNSMRNVENTALVKVL